MEFLISHELSFQEINDDDRKRFERLVAELIDETGKLDLQRLETLVSRAYFEADRDRSETAHSIATMIDELGETNQCLIEAFQNIS